MSRRIGVTSRKNYTRADYKRLIGMEKKRKKSQVGGGARKDAAQLLALLTMMSRKNKNTKQRNHIIEDLDTRQLNLLKRLARDFLKRKYTVTNQQLSKLSPHQELIYILADKPKIKRADKVKYFKQKGGILPALLPIIASVAAPLVGQIFKGI